MKRKSKEDEQRERTEQMNHMGAIPDRREKGPKPAAMEQREGDPKGEQASSTKKKSSDEDSTSEENTSEDELTDAELVCSDVAHACDSNAECCDGLSCEKVASHTEKSCCVPKFEPCIDHNDCCGILLCLENGRGGTTCQDVEDL